MECYKVVFLEFENVEKFFFSFLLKKTKKRYFLRKTEEIEDFRI
jgi:hypothetical protein